MSGSIARNITWLSAANIAVKPAWFVFITYICISQIGVSNYGTMTAALALMSISDGILSLGTNQYTIRELARARENTSAFFSNFFLLRVCTCVLAVASGLLIYQIIPNRGELLVAMFAGTFVSARSLTEYSHSIYRSAEDFRTDALLTVVEKVLIILFGSIFVFSHPTTTALLLGMTIGTGVSLVINWIWVHTKFAPFRHGLISTDFFRNNLPAAAPLGLAAIFVLIYFRTDSIMIEAMSGPVDAGQYAIGFRILESLILIPATVVAVILPRLSNLFGNSQGDFEAFSSHSAKVMLAIGVTVSVLVYALAPTAISLIDSSQEAEPAIGILRILIWCFPLAALNFVFSTTFVASNLQSPLAIILGLAAVLNLLLNLFLITSFGASGAAIATIATQAFVTFAFLYRMRPPKTT